MNDDCENYKYNLYDRWVGDDCRVWEKREWGWKFLGTCKSPSPVDVIQLLSNDCDHPYDIFVESESG